MHRITKITDVKPYEIECYFDGKELRKINLSEWVEEFKALDNGWTSRLADPSYFKSVTLASNGTLLWDNQVDFDSDVMYSLSEPAVEYNTKHNI